MPFNWGVAGLAFMEAADARKKLETEEARQQQEMQLKRDTLAQTKALEEAKIRADAPLKAAQVEETKARTFKFKTEAEEAAAKTSSMVANEAVYSGPEAFKKYADEHGLDVGVTSRMADGLIAVAKKGNKGTTLDDADYALVATREGRPPVTVPLAGAKFLLKADLSQAEEDLQKQFESEFEDSDLGWNEIAPAVFAMRKNQGLAITKPSSETWYQKQSDEVGKTRAEINKNIDRIQDNVAKQAVEISASEGKILADAGLTQFAGMLPGDKKKLDPEEVQALLQQADALPKLPADADAETRAKFNAAAGIVNKLDDFNKKITRDFYTPLQTEILRKQSLDAYADRLNENWRTGQSASSFQRGNAQLAASEVEARKAAAEKKAAEEHRRRVEAGEISEDGKPIVVVRPSGLPEKHAKDWDAFKKSHTKEEAETAARQINAAAKLAGGEVSGVDLQEIFSGKTPRIVVKTEEKQRSEVSKARGLAAMKAVIGPEKYEENPLMVSIGNAANYVADLPGKIATALRGGITSEQSDSIERVTQDLSDDQKRQLASIRFKSHPDKRRSTREKLMIYPEDQLAYYQVLLEFASNPKDRSNIQDLISKVQKGL